MTRSRLREQLGMSARYLLLASAAIAAAARLIGADGAKEIDLAKCRPQHVRKVGLAMHALPEQEARQPDFATRSDDQIRIRQICPIEMTSDSLGRNARLGPTIRATRSLPPPVAKPTTMRIGLLG